MVETRRRKPGPRPIHNSPLPWTGDFEDGLGNKITMHAYANPEDRNNELKRADGFGIARFNKKNRSVTFECWPRFSKVSNGDQAQFPVGQSHSRWNKMMEERLKDGYQNCLFKVKSCCTS